MAYLWIKMPINFQFLFFFFSWRKAERIYLQIFFFSFPSLPCHPLHHLPPTPISFCSGSRSRHGGRPLHDEKCPSVLPGLPEKGSSDLPALAKVATGCTRTNWQTAHLRLPGDLKELRRQLLPGRGRGRLRGSVDFISL